MLSFTHVVGKCQINLVIPIRTATKRAAGSRTSMKDSAGRRLGPKIYDGQRVNPGEIIMRQRGTKIYPGENVGIGKDHTLFALERGFLRYYLDPFHPRKKFAGIVLHETSILPRPHFDPIPRRFGHKLLDNRKAATKEENSLGRKAFLAKESILEGFERRCSQRQRLKDEFTNAIQKKLTETNIDLHIASEYLSRLQKNLRNGFPIEDAKFYSKQFIKNEATLISMKEKWSKEKLENFLESINSTYTQINDKFSFDNKLNLVDAIKLEEKEDLKKELLLKLKEDPVGTAKQICKSTSSLSSFLTLGEETKILRKSKILIKGSKSAAIQSAH